MTTKKTDSTPKLTVVENDTVAPPMTKIAKLKSIASNPMFIIPATFLTGAAIVLIKTAGKPMPEWSNDSEDV